MGDLTLVSPGGVYAAGRCAVGGNSLSRRPPVAGQVRRRTAAARRLERSR
jgi:hypothetical protein